MQELYVGVDVGGTTTKCVLADSRGEILLTETEATLSHEGPERVLTQIADLVMRVREGSQAPQAIGIAMPGLIDLSTGVTRFNPNFPTQWRNVKVRDFLQPKLDCPVYLLNDVRTATLGELVFGHGKNASTMLFFAIGTGIGGGVVVDGELRLGPLGAAGELGHQTILPNGPLCGCGNRGCLETLASGPALTAAAVRLLRSGLAPRLHEITEGELSKVSPETLAKAATLGDEHARTAIVTAAGYLGIGIANMVAALHPELVVIGGGVANIGDLLFNTVRETVLERVGMFPPDDVEIKPSSLGENAGALGAVALAMKQGLLKK
jgi:glucokinase